MIQNLARFGAQQRLVKVVDESSVVRITWRRVSLLSQGLQSQTTRESL
jgi:hypothetical protein